MTAVQLGHEPVLTFAARRSVATERADRAASIRGWSALIVATTARVLLYTIAGMLLWGAIPAVLGWQPTTVMSGSMMPRIAAGDVVVAMPVGVQQLVVGRVLLAQDPDHADHLRLHRFVSVDASGTLQLKGDANPQPDSSLVTPESVVGVAVLRVPYIGLPVVWLHEGRLPLVGATIAALAVLLLLSGADRRLRRDADEDAEEPEAEPERTPVRPRYQRLRQLGTLSASVLGAVLVISLALTGSARAAFGATTANPTNSFSAAEPFDCMKRTPTPSGAAVMFLAYNEASGIATDSSGNSRTGTLTGGATRSSGTCATGASPVLNLDGATGQVVSTSASSAAPQSFTVETWFRTNTTRGGKLIGFGNSQSGSSSMYDRHLYMTNTGTIVFGVYNGGYRTVTSPSSYNDNAWHLASATMTSGANGQMTLYIDGVSVGTPLANGAAESNTGWWRIGYDNLGGWPSAPTSNYFSGSLDNTAVYSALTADQIRAHFTAGR